MAATEWGTRGTFQRANRVGGASPRHSKSKWSCQMWSSKASRIMVCFVPLKLIYVFDRRPKQSTDKPLSVSFPPHFVAMGQQEINIRFQLCDILVEVLEPLHMRGQRPSPDVKTLCNFEALIWLETITSRDAQSACFKGSRTSCDVINVGVFFGQVSAEEKITSRDGFFIRGSSNHRDRLVQGSSQPVQRFRSC